MPPGLDGHGEDEGDNGMDGYRDRDHEDRHNGDGPLQTPVLLLCSRPSKGEQPVEPTAFRHAIPKKGDIRDHWEVEVDRAGRQIHGDAHDIPEQGGSQITVPNDIEGTIRPPEIEEHIPHPEKEHEDSDHLGRPGDRPSPFSLAQAKDGGYQRPGMADPDEEHEIRDVEAPIDRSAQASGAKAMRELIEPGEDGPRGHRPERPRGNVKAFPGSENRLEKRGIRIVTMPSVRHTTPPQR